MRELLILTVFGASPAFNRVRTGELRWGKKNLFCCFAGLAILLGAPPVQAQANACQNISGHIDGQLIGPSPLCGGGSTEIGTFTGAGGGTFLACITGFEQKGNGSLRFQLAHTYTTSSGDTFTTTDRVVAAPIDPPTEYLINNRVDITGGTGQLEDAFGFFRTHGTVKLQTGVVSVDYHGRICTP